MKTTMMIIFLSLTGLFEVNAQDLKKELSQAYGLLNSPFGADKQTALARFDKLAEKSVSDWSANYYAAYARAYLSTQEKDVKRKDLLLDEADKYVEKMNAVNAGNDESMVLTAYVAFTRFLIDPANRWKKYIPIMNANLDKAKKLNPDNPRIYYLQGVPVFNKPKLFGGGKNKAKPYFEKAKALYAKHPGSDIMTPYWGEKENAAYLVKCDD